MSFVTLAWALTLAQPDPVLAQIPPQPVDGLISWVYDYAEGKKKAAAEGKPLFVVFRCER